MCETDEADCEKEASNKEVNLNISQPISEAVMDGDHTPPFTPPPSEIILEVCDNNKNDTPSSLDHSMTDSARMSPSRSSDPIPLLGLEMEVDEYLGPYNSKLENNNQNTNEKIFSCEKCGYTAPGE